MGVRDELLALLQEIRRYMSAHPLRRDTYAMYEQLVVELLRSHRGGELAEIWRRLKAEAEKEPWGSRLRLALQLGRAVAEEYEAAEADPSGQLRWTFDSPEQSGRQAEPAAGSPTPKQSPTEPPPIMEDPGSGQYRFAWLADLLTDAPQTEAQSSGPAESGQDSSSTGKRDRYIRCLEKLLEGGGPGDFSWRSRDKAVYRSARRLRFLIRLYREVLGSEQASK